MVHKITDEILTIEQLRSIIENDVKIELSDDAKARIQKCRNYLDEKMSGESGTFYGINTGFGALHNTVISNEDLSQLQRNLVVSHACGAGEEVPRDIVKLMLLLKAKGLSYGNSGCQLETAQRLLDFYNNDIQPIVYRLGSLGASGDLAPLAHLALPLIGEGEVFVSGERMSATEMLSKFGWEPLTLKSKEGLALLNGTQFMSSYGVWCLMRAEEIYRSANLIGAASLDAYDGRISPFKSNVNAIRRQKGQIETAAQVFEFLSGSELIEREKEHVQDPYSFRCMPQVHGASKDTIDFVKRTLENEINAVTDNPTVFPDEDEIISAGNFHGQPLALAMDFLAIALAEIGSISERRVFRLIAGQRGLPPFLVAKPGLNSGFMIPQYTAASIASQNKQLCTPASVDTIESSNGQEDHVSMGANAATKCKRVVDNVFDLLGIELMNAAQAMEFRRPSKSSPLIERMIADFRSVVPFVDNDEYLHPHIEKSVEFVRKLK